MKKTFLTVVAVGFGVSVAFAQTAPAEAGSPAQAVNTEAVAQGEQDRTQVEMESLPAAAQDAFKNGQYSNLEVLAIYEIAPAEGSEAKVYEFELAEEATEAKTTEVAGVAVEQVSERQPDVVLHIDENGQLVKEEKLDEEEK